jgi:hypothetical protein
MARFAGALWSLHNRQRSLLSTAKSRYMGRLREALARAGLAETLMIDTTSVPLGVRLHSTTLKGQEVVNLVNQRAAQE